jgi:putative holliday junction resolvase
MRTLAIDLGTRRVGIALSDEGGQFATPYDVLAVTGEEAMRFTIGKLVEREGVQRLVVGLPLNMDGTFGPAATQTVVWARELAAYVQRPVFFVDERLSSFAAEQSLADRKRSGERITRQQKKERLDAIAAASFLQAFLDGRLQAIDVDSARR